MTVDRPYIDEPTGALVDTLEQQWSRSESLTPEIVFELAERLLGIEEGDIT